MEPAALSAAPQGRAAAERIGEGNACGAREGLGAWNIASRVSGLLDLAQAHPGPHPVIWYEAATWPNRKGSAVKARHFGRISRGPHVGLSAREFSSPVVAVGTLAAQAERERLSQLRFDNDATAFLELLAAHRQRVQLRRALLSSRVGLYAALGGGRPDSSDAFAGPPASSLSPREAGNP